MPQAVVGYIYEAVATWLFEAGASAVVAGLVATIVAEVVVYGAILGGLYAYNRQQQLKAQRALSALVNHTMTIKDSAAARPIIYGRSRVGGVLVFAQTAGTTNEYLYIVVCHAGHECDGFEEYYLDNNKVTLDGSGNVTSAVDQNGVAVTKYNGNVVWKTHLGASGQTADSMLGTDLGSGVWPGTATLSGICYSALKLTYSEENFAAGMPNVSVLLRGKKVYDPRSSTTAWSSNSALCCRDYLTDTLVGFGASSSEIDDTSCISAANTCDEAVALTAGGTESRYTANGVADTSTQAGSILSDLAASMAGFVSYVGGVFVIRAGAYATPTVTLTETDLRGAISITTRDSIRDVFNAVKGIYISAVNLWQPSDFPPVKNSGYITQDGAVFWRDIQLPFTSSSATAQRLAKIAMERERTDITVTFPAKLTALDVKVGDNVMLTLSRYGWSAQVFEVVSSSISVTTVDNAPLLGVDLILRLTNSGVWNWNSGLETPVNPASRSSLYNPSLTATATPTGLTAIASPAGAYLTWNANTEADFSHYNVYRNTVNTFAGSPIWSGLATAFTDHNVTPGTPYYYWITSVNSSGVESAPSGSVTTTPYSGVGPAGSNGATILGSVGGGGSVTSSSYANLSPSLQQTLTMDGAQHVVSLQGGYISNASGVTQVVYGALYYDGNLIVAINNGAGLSLAPGISWPLDFSGVCTPSAGSHTFYFKMHGDTTHGVAGGGVLTVF